MKETRKPYTVASYEAGKKAETRWKKNVPITYSPKSERWVFASVLFPRYAWDTIGKFLISGSWSEFDLFEKED